MKMEPVVFCPIQSFAGTGEGTGVNACGTRVWRVDLGCSIVGAEGGAEPPFIRLLESADTRGKRTLLSEVFEVGCIRVPVGSATLEQHTLAAYHELLETRQHPFLYRIWNFVPQINAVEPPQEENYRLFCAGRAEAFEHHNAQATTSVPMPSASAVGHCGNELIIVYWAGSHPVIHLENPSQIPAWRYPGRYGRKSPSFARASLVHHERSGWRFISGTAAIKASETQFPGDLQQQLRVTFDNLEIMVDECETALASRSAKPLLWQHALRVYVRHWDHLPEIKQRIGLNPMLASLPVVYQQADICRADLMVEIEMTSKFRDVDLTPGS